MGKKIATADSEQMNEHGVMRGKQNPTSNGKA